MEQSHPPRFGRKKIWTEPPSDPARNTRTHPHPNHAPVYTALQLYLISHGYYILSRPFSTQSPYSSCCGPFCQSPRMD